MHSFLSWLTIVAICISLIAAIKTLRNHRVSGREKETKISLLTIIAISISFLSASGLLYTRKAIDREKGAKISSLQNELKIVQPRHLSSDQKTRLLSKLSTRKGKVGFIIRTFDGESADFAEEIATAFRSAGWEVVPTNRTYLDDSPGFLNILLTSKNLEETANFIIQSFKEINIDCHRGEKIREGSLSGVFQPGTVYVVVGRK